MRSTISRVSFLIVLLVASVNALASAGRIIGFEGDVRVNGEQITEDTILYKEDTITTGDDGSVKIILSDNSVLDLDGGTAINIADYSYDTEEPDTNTSNIDVLAGSLRYVSGKIAKDDPEKVSFNAGNSTIGVRGTFISISVCPPDGCE